MVRDPRRWSSLAPLQAMARTDIPTHVRELILRHIESVQQVEILALLSGDADRSWTAASISRSLHIAQEPCGKWIDRFVAAGILVGEDEGVRFAAGGKRSRAAVDLVDLYSRRRTTVIEAIYNKPGTAIQSFSDAFRLRGDR
jgi:DNA-binding Lrp family transcriptional regulator